MSKQTKTIEIEIQVQIEDRKNLLAFLKKNAKFTGEHHQVDNYYSPEHRNFIKVRPIKEWLRLRNSSGKCSINYKNWYFDEEGKSHYCDEYESLIKDIKQLENIFQALNMQPVTVVEKTRQTWIYKDYEVALDSIKNLGDFVEIEFKGKYKGQDPKKITKKMVSFLKDIGCGQISRNYVGYPFQLLFPKEVECEEC